MTTFNHAFSIGFAVPESRFEDPDQCWVHETDAVIAALLKRVAGLLADRSEYMEACDPFDTYEE